MVMGGVTTHLPVRLKEMTFHLMKRNIKTKMAMDGVIHRMEIIRINSPLMKHSKQILMRMVMETISAVTMGTPALILGVIRGVM